MRLKIFDNVVTTETSCKTWGCLACRDRVKRYVRMRMEHGVLILKDCYLITVTYVFRGEESKKGAKSVGKDWAEFTRKWNLKWSSRIRWFRVPELTKNGQVHLHLIIGGIGKRISCCRPAGMGSCAHKKSYAWAMATCKVDCVEHEVAKEWYAITKDSWVVDCRAVWSAAGASAYIFKYLDKGFDDRAALEALGFKRRWSCSRNWPAPERMQYMVTMSKGWQHTQFYKRGINDDFLKEEVIRSERSPYAMKVGTPLAEMYEGRVKKQRVKAMYERIVGNAESGVQEDVT